ncbi:MAG: hypothetical protein DMF63_05765 [Acidobacteria bacterium]|nr:MAG: hypothetical protein DMF63_05765 [Acidobacteriota bacterium]
MARVLKNRFSINFVGKTTILLLLSVVFFFAPTDASAQRRFSKSYPATRNVRLNLLNRSGTVTVEGWNRAEVQIQAYMETPAAAINPQIIDGTIIINMVKENFGRGEVGNVNFTIRVPFEAKVDIETKIGNLNVSSVRGALVRAKISSDGDITLTNINAQMVSAENGIGNIFFDGDIQSGGTYRFTSISGDINLRVPFNSSFKLIATAPSTRSINLGSFSTANMRILGDGRRVAGQVGDGSSSLLVTNQRGSIAFIRR